MLTHLNIRNFAIIEQVDLELASGMTVLTGETGAGKSILGDALSLALGDRSSGNMVRFGADRAEIVAEFDADEFPAVNQWLVEHELDQPDGTCMLKRSISSDGRSRAFVNGRPVPVQILRELGDMLVDIHGQHAHQSLMRRQTQRQLLDEHADHGHLLHDLSHLHQRWQQIARDMRHLGGSRSDRDAQIELLRYQVGELQALALGDGEVATLDEEHARLSNAGRLIEGALRAAQLLDAEDTLSTLTSLGGANHELEGLLAYDDNLRSIQELVETAVIHVKEASGELRHYLDGIELDPERLQWVESRIDTIHQLARKHRVPPTELPELLVRLETELADLAHGEEHLQALETEREALLVRYREQAAALHESREQAARTLAEAVTRNMQELGMPGGRFAVRVEAAHDEPPSPGGMDRVEFVVAANPGQPLKPLTQVASGGELSRISLAIQVIGAGSSGVPTLIFDEVDVGIGGRVAEMVGQQLRKLGEVRQVLCITHLPQVASQGQNHLQVRKKTREDATFTQIDPLRENDRIEEIARMLGGLEITQQTRAHAREMIERARADAHAREVKGKRLKVKGQESSTVIQPASPP